MKIAILCGMQEEANTVPRSDNIVILQGIPARDSLDATVPPDTDAIISWGIAGGMDPIVRVGEVVVCSALLLDPNSKVPTTYSDQTWRRQIVSVLAGLPAIPGRAFSGPTENGATPIERAKLFNGTACQIADMGTYAVAVWAVKHGKPWAAVGAVSDVWDQTVSNFDDFVNPDGTLNLIDAAGHILRDPAEWPMIIREAWTSEVALHNLAIAGRMLANAGWAL